ncbi:MAG: enoyl-CoA hydratase/isomerase family protein [Desulfosarcinaceae bacterium]|nr:enoyl-CoA hydratase/isomerase family protein [Desulfosarcinaceae bacterium]
MAIVTVEHEAELAIVTLQRGKVNALNGTVVAKLKETLACLEADAEVRAVVLTGRGDFFSFGFDIPELYPLSREAFTAYLTHFTSLYTDLFLFPKPVVAALNGHTIAGGCMLALACDYRVMATGNAKIALNEIDFGSTVLAGSIEMLRFQVGNRNATKILYSGTMYSAEEAQALRLIEQMTSPNAVKAAAVRVAADLAAKHPPAFASMKHLLRQSVAEKMRDGEADAIQKFVDIWYSATLRENLTKIQIRS